MEAKIIKITQFTDKAGQIFRTFKLQHEWDFFWFSELTFNSYPELFTTSDNAISFKEPFDQYFLFEKKKNKNGEFLVLLPKKTGNVPPFLHQSVKYDYDIIIPEEKKKSEESSSLLIMTDEQAIKWMNTRKLKPMGKISATFKMDLDSQKEQKNTFVPKDNTGLFENSIKGNEDATIVQSNPNSDMETVFTKAIKIDEDKINKPNDSFENGLNIPNSAAAKQNYKVAEDEFAGVSEPVALFESKSVVNQQDAPPKKRKLIIPPKPENLKQKKSDYFDLIKKGASIEDFAKNSIFGKMATKQDIVDEFGDDFANQVFTSPDDFTGQANQQQTNNPDSYKDENKSHSSNEKLSFINGLINLSSKRNVVEKTRERLFGLIGKELERYGMPEDKILLQIQKDVESIKMHIGADYDYSQPTSEAKSGHPVNFNKPAHKPRSTAKFLSNFKFDNDTGLKELVHRPNSKTQDTHELLEKVKKHPVLSNEFGYGRTPGFEPINNLVRSETIELVKQFEKSLTKDNANVERYFHPFGVNYDFTEKAKKFKRNYRFGPAGDDTYSCLRILIKDVAESCINKFNYSINFDPEENVFDMVSTFISWGPALEKGLTSIFNGLSDSTNIKGNKKFQETKRIQVRSTKDREREMVNIFIEDVDSIAKHDEKEILKFFRGSDPVTKNYFWGLCNWSVLFDNPNGSFELRILSDKVSEYKDEPILKLNKKINAFVHKLSFYNL